VTDVALERRLLAEQGLDMRRREQYGAVQSYDSDRTCDRVASAFYLHIAVIDDPGDLLGTEDQVARNVERIGQTRFGSGWSYNAAAFNTGRLYEGQPLTRRGTHTVNTFRRRTCPTHGGSLEAPDTSSGFNNNINSRALVLPQDVDDPVTDEQIDAAARWAAAQIRSGLAKPTARWHGHRCVTNKGCPGDRAFTRIPELQRLTDHYVKHGLGDSDMVTDQDIEKIAELASDMAVAKLLAANVAAKGPTVKAALRAAAKTPAGDKRLEQVLVQAVEGLVNVGVSGVTHEQIVRAVQDALRQGTGTGA
jgi:hypothetical protein